MKATRGVERASEIRPKNWKALDRQVEQPSSCIVTSLQSIPSDAEQMPDLEVIGSQKFLYPVAPHFPSNRAQKLILALLSSSCFYLLPT